MSEKTSVLRTAVWERSRNGESVSEIARALNTDERIVTLIVNTFERLESKRRSGERPLPDMKDALRAVQSGNDPKLFRSEKLRIFRSYLIALLGTKRGLVRILNGVTDSQARSACLAAERSGVRCQETLPDASTARCSRAPSRPFTAALRATMSSTKRTFRTYSKPGAKRSKPSRETPSRPFIRIWTTLRSFSKRRFASGKASSVIGSAPSAGRYTLPTRKKRPTTRAFRAVPSVNSDISRKTPFAPSDDRLPRDGRRHEGFRFVLFPKESFRSSARPEENHLSLSSFWSFRS